MMRDILLGTWNYKVKEAPFGFRTGRVIFFEADGEVNAKLKIYGLTIKTKDLVIEGTKIAFNAQVDIEQVAIRLELVGDQLHGLVHMSEGALVIEVSKKVGQQKRRTKAEAAMEAAEKAVRQQLVERRKPLKKLCQQIDPGVKAHTYYYGWYGNPEFDGDYIGWNSAIVSHWIETTWDEVPPYQAAMTWRRIFIRSWGATATAIRLSSTPTCSKLKLRALG